jgi:Zn-dependent peptidase ImmA (M78 family)
MNATPEWQVIARIKAKEILLEYSERHPLRAPLPINDIIEEYVGDIKIMTEPIFPDGVSAFSTKDMNIGWVVAINGKECMERQRFSAAHELGHICLLPTQPRTVFCSTNDDWVERLCNYFAGYLLMPKSLVNELYVSSIPSLSEVARKFRVSPAVAEIQLKQLGLSYLP